MSQKKVKKNYKMKKTAFLLLFYPIFSFSQVEKDYKCILDSLCSENMHGRGYTQQGHIKAADYIQKLYTEIGLNSFDSSYLQSFPLTVNTFPEQIFLSINQQKLKLGENYLIAPASHSCNEEKKVFRMKKNMTSTQLHKKRYSQKAPFITADIYSKYKDKEQLHTLLSPFSLQIQEKPILYGSLSQSQANNTHILLKQGTIKNIKKIKIELKSELRKLVSQNVIGYIKGVEQEDSLIVVCAHYDHLGGMGQVFFPGANDNASGTALMLCLAKYFIKKPLKKSIVFIAFGGEEAGLVGSRFFVEHPLFDLKKTSFVINLDLWGSGSKGITVVNGTEFTTAFERLKKINNRHSLVKTIKARKPSPNSDHYPFYNKGVPSFFMYAMGNDGGYHSIFDIPEKTEIYSFKNNFELLKKYIESF